MAYKQLTYIYFPALASGDNDLDLGITNSLGYTNSLDFEILSYYNQTLTTSGLCMANIYFSYPDTGYLGWQFGLRSSSIWSDALEMLPLNLKLGTSYFKQGRVTITERGEANKSNYVEITKNGSVIGDDSYIGNNYNFNSYTIHITAKATNVYGYKQYNANGTLIHDFVPAKRTTDSVYGLYDLKTGTFCECSTISSGGAETGTIVDYWTISYSTAQGTRPSSTTVSYSSGVLSSTNLPTISASGYRFDGWYYSSSYATKANVGDTISSSKTLYAKWTALYTVSFNTDGGSSISSQTVASGEKATRPSDPTKSGYIFDNWYTSSSYTTLYDFNTIISSNKTIYAKFEAIDAKNMKNVISWTIPEGNVKKVVDSNGNIIWGSRAAFPYRRLEYINFSGNDEYIQTNFYAGTANINHQCEFSASTKTPGGTNNAQVLIGTYDNSLANELRRFYPIHQNASGIRCSIGAAWSSYATNFDANDKLKFSLTYNKDSNGYPRGYWYLTKNGTSIGSANPLTQSTAGNLSTRAYLCLGCQVTGPTSERLENYWNGKIYNYQRRQNNATGTLLTNYIPCQRKSDGVCGLYDTVGNAFYPMQGTNITSAAAGPIVDEYWDLTD